MSFPIEIPRGSRPLLRFNDLDAFRRWIKDEDAANTMNAP